MPQTLGMPFAPHDVVCEQGSQSESVPQRFRIVPQRWVGQSESRGTQGPASGSGPPSKSE
jgi:hypothetical protein